MKSFVIKLCSMMASLALAVVMVDANTSSFVFHQPKLPEEAKKQRRF